MIVLPLIRTQRLTLEPLRIATVDALFEAEWRVEQGKAPALRRSDHEVRERLLRWAGLGNVAQPTGTWMIDVEGKIVGRAGMDRPDDRGPVYLSYALAPNMRGQGLATEAASALLDWILDRSDGIDIHAVARPTNHASLAVMKRLGMAKHPDSDADNIVFYVRRPS